jgi:hypothetical protein
MVKGLLFGRWVAPLAAALASVACSSSAPETTPGSDAAAPIADASPDVADASDANELPPFDAASDGRGCGTCQTGTFPLHGVAGETCTFTWAVGTAFDPSRVNVEIVLDASDAGGTPLIIANDPTNGWQYDTNNSPTQVILHGKSCSEYEAAPSPQVLLLQGCPAMVPPAC